MPCNQCEIYRALPQNFAIDEYGITFANPCSGSFCDVPSGCPVQFRKQSKYSNFFIVLNGTRLFIVYFSPDGDKEKLIKYSTDLYDNLLYQNPNLNSFNDVCFVFYVDIINGICQSEILFSEEVCKRASLISSKPNNVEVIKITKKNNRFICNYCK